MADCPLNLQILKWFLNIWACQNLKEKMGKRREIQRKEISEEKREGGRKKWKNERRMERKGGGGGKKRGKK